MKQAVVLHWTIQMMFENLYSKRKAFSFENNTLWDQQIIFQALTCFKNFEQQKLIPSLLENSRKTLKWFYMICFETQGTKYQTYERKIDFKMWKTYLKELLMPHAQTTDNKNKFSGIVKTFRWGNVSIILSVWPWCRFEKHHALMTPASRVLLPAVLSTMQWFQLFDFLLSCVIAGKHASAWSLLPLYAVSETVCAMSERWIIKASDVLVWLFLLLYLQRGCKNQRGQTSQEILMLCQNLLLLDGVLRNCLKWCICIQLRINGSICW